ncbi:MAG: hypothetical protein WCN92_10370, partial [Eubacteriales bacterium]
TVLAGMKISPAMTGEIKLNARTQARRTESNLFFIIITIPFKNPKFVESPLALGGGVIRNSNINPILFPFCVQN